MEWESPDQSSEERNNNSENEERRTWKSSSKCQLINLRNILKSNLGVSAVKNLILAV